MNNYENVSRSLSSIKKVDDYGMFQMNYYGDYKFDEFLKVGARNHDELDAIIQKLLFEDIEGIEAKLKNPGGECTVFATRNLKGEVVHCRNYDFNTYSPPLQLTTRPQNGYASISTISMQYLDYGVDNLPSGLNAQSLMTLIAPYIPADGVNEKGVAISLMSVSEAQPPYSEDKISLNTTAVIRLILDKAASVDEAIKLLKEYNVFFSFDICVHYLISDASGRSVVVEYWDNEMHVTETQIASNFIECSPEKIAQGNAHERYDKVKEKLDAFNGTLNKTQMIDLLVDIGWPNLEFGSGTQWSVLYNLSTLEGTIYANSNTSNLVDFCLEAVDE